VSAGRVREKCEPPLIFFESAAAVLRGMDWRG
jgi:hypothetical protein